MFEEGQYGTIPPICPAGREPSINTFLRRATVTLKSTCSSMHGSPGLPPTLVDTSGKEEVSLCGSSKTQDKKIYAIEWRGQEDSEALTAIDVSCNKLTFLHAGISRLTSLKRINVSSNRLTALPNTLFKLSSLTTLILGHNCLTALPENIGDLKCLSGLYVNDNHLVKMPESAGQLTSLLIVDIDNNKWNPPPPKKTPSEPWDEFFHNWWLLPEVEPDPVPDFTQVSYDSLGPVTDQRHAASAPHRAKTDAAQRYNGNY